MKEFAEYNIREPIWMNLSVGLAEWQMSNHNMCKVNVLYKDKKGRRLYPKPFYISRTKALTYPVQSVGGLRLRIVPLSDMTTNQNDHRPQ